MQSKLSAAKAQKILEDGTIYKKPLTNKQKRFFQAVAHGMNPHENGREIAQTGLSMTGFNPISKIRKNLADNMYPYGYYEPIKRVFKAGILGEKEKEREVMDNSKVKNQNNWMGLRVDLTNMYYHQPQRYNNIYKSKYKPTISKNEKSNYYSSRLIKDALLDHIINRKTMGGGPHNETTGRFIFGEGYDPERKENYYSFYDKWNLAPFKLSDRYVPILHSLGLDEDQSLGLGTPVELYDRIYRSELPDDLDKLQRGRVPPLETSDQYKERLKGLLKLQYETGGWLDKYQDGGEIEQNKDPWLIRKFKSVHQPYISEFKNELRTNPFILTGLGLGKSIVNTLLNPIPSYPRKNVKDIEKMWDIAYRRATDTNSNSMKFEGKDYFFPNMTDYGKKLPEELKIIGKDIEDAKLHARKNGYKNFIHNGKIYTTDLNETPEQQMLRTGITNDQVQYNRWLHKRIVDNVVPVGYNHIGSALKSIILNRPEKGVGRSYESGYVPSKKYFDTEAGKFESPTYADLDDAFRLTFGFPTKYKTIEVSDSKLNPNKVYYKTDYDTNHRLLNYVVGESMSAPYNKQSPNPQKNIRNVPSWIAKGLGKFTGGIAINPNTNKPVVYYYDENDYQPFGYGTKWHKRLEPIVRAVGESTGILGKPFKYYGTRDVNNSEDLKYMMENIKSKNIRRSLDLDREAGIKEQKYIVGGQIKPYTNNWLDRYK